MSTYYASIEDASNVIKEWAKRTGDRIQGLKETGKRELALEETLFVGGGSEEYPDITPFAVLATCIIGMYIPEDQYSCQGTSKRIAQVQEKLLETLQKTTEREYGGEEWRG